MVHLEQIKNIVREYNNKSLDYGTRDCNLMILDIYEPDKADTLRGTYDDVISGLKQSKKLLGYDNLQDILESKDYEIIPTKFAAFGDIGKAPSPNTFVLHLGASIFAINEDDIFTNNPTKSLNIDDYIFYRRSNV